MKRRKIQKSTSGRRGKDKENKNDIKETKNECIFMSHCQMSNEFQFGKDMKNNKDRGRAETYHNLTNRGKIFTQDFTSNIFILAVVL